MELEELGDRAIQKVGHFSRVLKQGVAKPEKTEGKTTDRHSFAAIAEQWMDFMASKLAPQTMTYYQS